MRVYAIWEGGYGNYAPSDIVNDLEAFDSIEAAKSALKARLGRGYSYLQSFEFVNRDAERVYCPCVGDDTRMLLWSAADTDDGVVYVPECPDRVLTVGPRGGVREGRGC